jgi:hypothetical protein
MVRSTVVIARRCSHCEIAALVVDPLFEPAIAGRRFSRQGFQRAAFRPRCN